MESGSWNILRRVLRLFEWVAATMLVQATWAADFPPKTYASPSGKYSLSVDPSDRRGGGKAHYVLKHGGQVAWSGDEPFTFWEAFVANDGTFGGYAYSEGEGYSQDPGEFIVALLDTKGNVRTINKTPREHSHYLHTSADPKAGGIFAQPENDRFVVRVIDPDVNNNAESWWSFRLSDGHLIGKSTPRDEMDSSKPLLLAARPVANTPLTLVHWLTSEWKDAHYISGAKFTLVDLSNKPVWILDLPRDYGAAANVFEDIREHGAIFDGTQPAHFAIRHFAAGLRVTYVATPNPSQDGKWDVTETGRTVFSASTASESMVRADASTVEVSLKKISSIDLAGNTSEESSPIHDVWDFVPGEAGRFGVLRDCGCESEGKHSLAIVNDSGKLAREIPLPKFDGKSFTDHLAWLKGDTWLVTTSVEDGRSKRSSAVRVDAGTGVVTPLPAFVAPSVDSLAGFADGGFVALTKDYKTYTIEDTVTAFDAQGNKRWDIHEGQDEGELSSPEAVAVVTTGEVVVLENPRKELKIFTPEGAFRTTMKLKDAWGRDPNYPSGLRADSSGGVIVHDFNGSPPFVRMSRTGDVLAAFTPAYKDGRKFDIRGDVQSSPAGELWTSDGHALLHLDRQGIVDRVLGAKPNANVLGRISAVVVTRKGWIYAADERTGAVHVFNEMGELQHVCEPDVHDYKGKLSLPSLTVADSGDVFISHTAMAIEARPDFLHYDAFGKRIGVEKVSVDEVAQAWLSQAGTTNQWVLGYRRAYLVDSNANVLRPLERTADGQWLETPGPGSGAPDGSVAIVSGAKGDPMSSTQPKALVSIFSADGNPTVTWPAPDNMSPFNGAIAYDGERLAFLLGKRERPNAILLTDKQGHALSKAAYQSGDYIAAVFFVQGREGSELWVFDGKSKVDRFAMP
jgi:hypothetical protein